MNQACGFKKKKNYMQASVIEVTESSFLSFTEGCGLGKPTTLRHTVALIIGIIYAG